MNLKLRIVVLVASLWTGFSVSLAIQAAPSVVPAVCREQIQTFCHGRNDQSCFDELSAMANRTTRSIISGFDDTKCSEALRRARQPSLNGYVCEQVRATVTQALVQCWQRFATGCVHAVVQKYNRDLVEAGRSDHQCRAKIEWSCRSECYPRFPSGCNASCATLGRYIP